MFQPPGHREQDELTDLGETFFSTLKENTPVPSEKAALEVSGALPTPGLVVIALLGDGFVGSEGAWLFFLSFFFFLFGCYFEFPWKVKKEKIIF